MESEKPIKDVVVVDGNADSNDNIIYVETDKDGNERNVQELSWNQLKNRYASSNDDFQELANLLESWNLFDLFPFFVGK